MTDTMGTVKYGNSTDFEFEIKRQTEVFESCAITFKGEFYVFGGNNKNTQISKINNCKLEFVGLLQFNFRYGACTNVNDSDLFLCFDWDNHKTCRKSSNSSGPFTTISDSIFTHIKTRIANDWGELKFRNYKTII